MPGRRVEVVLDAVARLWLDDQPGPVGCDRLAAAVVPAHFQRGASEGGGAARTSELDALRRTRIGSGGGLDHAERSAPPAHRRTHQILAFHAVDRRRGRVGAYLGDIPGQ
jgi:hypothetical protein